MMTKAETAKYLCGIGYTAENINDKVIVWCKEPMRLGQKERVRSILRSVGYKGRWGWKVKKR